jgi:hypothetical protein
MYKAMDFYYYLFLTFLQNRTTKPDNGEEDRPARFYKRK